MKITGITITHHRLPLDPPFRASWDTRPRTHFDSTVVRVETDAGVTGFGSGDLMVGFAGHEHLFVGQDPFDVERHFRILDNIQFHYGRCWPLDFALWDIMGKALGQPVWRLLGGAGRRVRAYASSGTLRDPEAMATQAERYLEQGFGAMKIRFQRGDWRDDIRALEAVRRRVGDRLTLMVDCNQGWRMPWDTAAPWTLKDALRVARELETLDIYWMEEPLHRADYAGMAALRQMTDVRIAGGEMDREMHELRTVIERGCLDVLQPDAALVGGLTGLARIARMAREHNIDFTPHTWTNGFGMVANAHLAAGVAQSPWLEYPFDPPEWTPERRDFVMAEPFRVGADGWFELDDKPGLGIELDEARLRRTRL